MSNGIKLDGTIYPYDTIKFIKPLTDEDRQRIKDKYGTDVSDRNIHVTFADKSQKTFTPTLEAVQEVTNLTAIGEGKHVVTANIQAVQPFTTENARQARDKGMIVGDHFKSRVVLTGKSSVLSTVEPGVIVDSRAKALGLNNG